jgi:hypothetical protein
MWAVVSWAEIPETNHWWKIGDYKWKSGGNIPLTDKEIIHIDLVVTLLFIIWVWIWNLPFSLHSRGTSFRYLILDLLHFPEKLVVWDLRQMLNIICLRPAGLNAKFSTYFHPTFLLTKLELHECQIPARIKTLCWAVQHFNLLLTICIAIYRLATSDEVWHLNQSSRNNVFCMVDVVGFVQNRQRS